MFGDIFYSKNPQNFNLDSFTWKILIIIDTLGLVYKENCCIWIKPQESFTTSYKNTKTTVIVPLKQPNVTTYIFVCDL